MGPSFQPDAKIAKVAEAYAADATALAATTFNVQLDWTDRSIERVEQILSILHQSLPNAKPPPEVVQTFAKGFGSYVGEVFRKNHGGEWGMITQVGDPFPGIRAARDGQALLWPWGRVHDRLLKGEESNVWHYYQALTTR